MLKRKVVEPDGPLDPRGYAPDLGALWDCVRMGAELIPPSLSYLATMAWHRGYPEDLSIMVQGDRPSLPAPVKGGVWTYLVWVLSSHRKLEAPSGAKMLIEILMSRGNCANRIVWYVYFPKSMGGDLDYVCWTYEILRTGLYEVDYKERPHYPQRLFREVMPHVTGDPIRALKRRRRWFALDPIDPKESPPAWAQEILERLWECREESRCCGSRWGFNQLTKDPDQVFNAVVWLFLKGYTNVAAHRRLGAGVISSYRLKRRKTVVNSLRAMPAPLRRKLVSVFRDAPSLLRMQNEIDSLSDWPASPSVKKVQAHFGDRFDPLVVEVMFSVLKR